MEYPALNRGLFALFGDIPLLHFPLTPYSYFLYVFSFLASLSRNPWREKISLDSGENFMYNHTVKAIYGP